MKDCAEFYVKPYQYNAFADYIIRKHPDYEKWVNNQFIQIFGQENADAIYVDYYCGSVYGKLPLLDVVDYSYLIKGKKIEEAMNLISDGLHKGYYYYCFLDHFFIESMPEFQKEQNVHDVLITLMNNDGVTYMENVRGYFGEFFLDRESFITNLFTNESACLYELKVDQTSKYDFDIHKLVHMQEDFMFAKNSMLHNEIYMDETRFFSEEFYQNKESLTTCYGIDVYPMLQRLSLRLGEKQEYIDYRMFYILFERNGLMIKRLEYLQENDFLTSGDISELVISIQDVCAKLKLCMNRVIKYNFKKQEKDILALCEDLKEVHEKEKKVGMRILDLFYSIDSEK